MEPACKEKIPPTCNVCIGRNYCILYVCTLLVMHYTFHTNFILDFASLLGKKAYISRYQLCICLNPSITLPCKFLNNVRILYKIFMTSCLQQLATIYMKSGGQQNHSLI